MKSALLSSALIPIALFGGCDLPEPADPFAGLPPAAGGAQWQVDRGGPPPSILLEAEESGGEVEVMVILPVPPAPADGVAVHLVLGGGGEGSGSCFNVLNGKCLSILPPYTIHGPFDSAGGQVV